MSAFVAVVESGLPHQLAKDLMLRANVTDIYSIPRALGE